MKRNVLIIAAMFIIVISISIFGIYINKQIRIESKIQNKEFEIYTKDEIYGADVITIINNAINQNEKNNILKNEDGYYIENDNNSIIIEIVMITNEEKKQTKSYRMEKIAKVGIQQFISNFNTAKFKISRIEYHDVSGKLKYIEITQQY